MSLPQFLHEGPEVHISWDGSGDFEGEFDDVSQDVDGPSGLTISEGRDGVQQLSPPKVGSGAHQLINDDGRYSQDRPDSPVYQRVEPTKPVRYQVAFGDEREYDSDTDYDADVYYDGRATFQLGRHMIDEIEERSAWGDQRVKLTTIGYETVLTRAPVTVGVMANPRVDECFEALLDAAGWPSDKRRIAVADTTLLYWWCDERTPWVAMLELLQSEGPGTFGVDRDGVFYFENRNFRTTEDRSTTSQATVSDTDTGSGLYCTALTPISPFRNIRNRATYATKRRTLGSLTAVWSYGATLTLSANQSVTLIVRPQNPFQDAVTPASPTDYTVSAGSLSSVTLSADSGLVAFLTIVAGAGGATVTGLQLRAKPLTVVSETVVQNGVDASASITRYSPIPGADIPLTLVVGGWPEIDPANAQGVCDAWVLRQMWPRAQVSFVLRNADGAHLERILTSRVSDRLTLVNQQTGLNADVWVNQMDLTISGHQGRVVQLVVGAEKCDALAGAVWDDPDALWDDPSTVWGV